MTRLLGLIGFPLKHSVSPVFQQAALDHLGIEARYELWETPREEFPRAAARLRDPNCLGANVTIPYKEAITLYLDDVSPEAREIGAVNTVVNEGGRLKGYNTDAPGFLQGLLEAGFEPQGAEAAILGAGGAALAAGYSLIKAGVSFLWFINRTPSRGEKAALRLQTFLRPGQKIASLPLEPQSIRDILARCRLVVNATPVGMKHSPWEGETPIPPEIIPPEALVYDVVYNPLETPLLRAARERGSRVVDGLRMLIYQGARGFRLWTGREAPVEVMFRAALEALRG